MGERVLVWEGCQNVRDLGGLTTSDGQLTQFGAMVRSGTPVQLTVAGWSALYGYGIRTIVTLFTYGMEDDRLNVVSPYPDVTIVRVAIEDITDKEFLERWAKTDFWGTPLYYHDALLRWPTRHAAAVSAIARAKPGGVLFHCGRGHDRTGIIALLLLTLAGVDMDEIVADYELSVDPERDELMAREHTTVREALTGALDGLDIKDYLAKSGASPSDMDTVRLRLLGSAG